MRVAVILCIYTERRWDDLVAGVEAVARQTWRPDELLVVVDHNPALLERCRRELAPRAAVPLRVLASVGPPGLSAARNTGVVAATADVVAFLDDDACPEPRWLEALVAPYDDEQVIGTAGRVLPRWPDERPAWFPEEFDWVVGCSYAGLPTTDAPVRNPIGASMSFRRSGLAHWAAPFSSDLGRVGTLPLGCEETELAIRLTQRHPGTQIHYAPESVVLHRVSADRTELRYFLRRCWSEGLSKACVVRAVGAAGVTSERSYVLHALPRGLARALVDRRPRRAAALVLGLLATAAGYGAGRARTMLRSA